MSINFHTIQKKISLYSMKSTQLHGMNVYGSGDVGFAQLPSPSNDNRAGPLFNKTWTVASYPEIISITPCYLVLLGTFTFGEDPQTEETTTATLKQETGVVLTMFAFHLSLSLLPLSSLLSVN